MKEETVRKVTYAVGGVLPASFFSIVSLLTILMPPATIWTIAAWTGLAGLVRAIDRSPYDEIHAKTSAMLACGVVAMAPATAFLFVVLRSPPLSSGDLALNLIFLGSLSTLLVAFHFLYFQFRLLIANWLVELIPGNEQH